MWVFLLFSEVVCAAAISGEACSVLLEVTHEPRYLLIAPGSCLLCCSPAQPQQVDEYLRRARQRSWRGVGGFLLSAGNPKHSCAPRRACFVLLAPV